MAILNFQDYRPQIGPSNFIAPSADIIGQVYLGEESSVFFNCTLRGDINSIQLGKSTNIQDNSVIHVSTPLGVEIGDNVSVGHQCCIHACKVGNSVLVGMGSILLDGCQVGDNSLIAAGTLVPKDKSFPPGSLIMGSPAKLIRKLSDSEIEDIFKLSLKYVGVKNQYLNGSP